METTVEERLRRLERFRYLALARINLLQTLAVGAWCNICLQAPDPNEYARIVTEAWNAGASAPQSFPGVDPGHLDLLSQEYEEAVAAVANQVVAHVRKMAPK